MKLLVSIVALATVSTVCMAADQQQPSQMRPVDGTSGASSPALASGAPNGKPGLQQANNERQGRSISSSSGNANNLLDKGNSNVIEHSSNKERLELERRAVQEFITTKNIFKSIMKILFGNQDEIRSTSRTVLNVLSQALDLLKSTFGQKSRSGTARTIRDSAEEATSAGISILQGYVKSVLTDDPSCAKRHVCRATREAIRDGRDLGYVIATVGGYATGYLLDSSKPNDSGSYSEASLKARSMKEDCEKLYPNCQEKLV